jgi:K+-transporting ATPase KdpF subunit
MTWVFVLGAVVAGLLLIYLLCALLKPEWFQ